MKKYFYARDPVCLVACACYAVNRWCLPAALKGPFLRNYFDDFFLIPAALPMILWVQSCLRLRPSAAPPQWQEVALHLVVWSIAAEWVGPHLFAHATGDIRDVLSYAAGGLIAAMIWNVA